MSSDNICSEKGYCYWLTDVLVPYSDEMSEGIAVVELFDHDTKEASGKYVGYQKDLEDKFKIFNYCPFCGFDFNGAKCQRS